jgi:hypothetical protein
MKRELLVKKFRSDQRCAATRFRKVVRSASLPKGGTSKKRPSPHLHKVPTRRNKVSPRTLQTALVLRAYVHTYIHTYTHTYTHTHTHIYTQESTIPVFDLKSVRAVDRTSTGSSTHNTERYSTNITHVSETRHDEGFRTEQPEGKVKGKVALLTLALDRGEWSASRPSRFTPGERDPGTHWIGGWVGPRAGLEAVVRRKIPSPCRDSNLRSSSP